MPKPLLLSLLALVAVGAAPSPASAQATNFIDPRPSGEAPERAPWREQAIVLPAPPQDDNLLELKTRDLDQRYTYLLDAASISVGEDEVVRYTVVIAPRNGPRHVVYEGMRCSPNVTRVYAVGTASGFREREDEPWQSIPSRGPFAYRDYIHRDIACDQASRPHEPQEIVDRVRRPQVKSANQDRQPFFFDKRR